MHRETTGQKKCTEKPHGKKNVQRNHMAKKMYRETTFVQRNASAKKCTEKPQHKKMHRQTTDKKTHIQNTSEKTHKPQTKKTHREITGEKNAQRNNVKKKRTEKP